ncbi:putative membrane protein [Sporosarcina luteola]|nr:putative membrane protein [Sporosarcina luteola]
METIIFLATITFLSIMQAATPYFIKQTVAFGVSIPEDQTDNKQLASYKRKYTITVLIIGILAVILYSWSSFLLSGEKLIFVWLALQFVVLACSMILYFLLHLKVMALKKSEAWGSNLKQVTVTDLSMRSQDEMLPTFLFALPVIITLGLIVYTATQYAALPERIPTHWGPNGQPDAFSDKSPLSAVALLLILLVIQIMSGMMHWATKNSGIRLRAAKRQTSKIQQLTFRKYSSWLLFFMSLSITVLMGYTQLTTIHEGLGSDTVLFLLPIGFLILVLAATAFYAFKIGQGGSRIGVDLPEEITEGFTNTDEDAYWKAGIFYVNRNDPSLIVEKRFGVGWTMNFGQPLSYFIILVPLLLIFLISFLL